MSYHDHELLLRAQILVTGCPWWLSWVWFEVPTLFAQIVLPFSSLVTVFPHCNKPSHFFLIDNKPSQFSLIDNKLLLQHNRHSSRYSFLARYSSPRLQVHITTNRPRATQLIFLRWQSGQKQALFWPDWTKTSPLLARLNKNKPSFGLFEKLENIIYTGTLASVLDSLSPRATPTLLINSESFTGECSHKISKNIILQIIWKEFHFSTTEPHEIAWIFFFWLVF